MRLFDRRRALMQYAENEKKDVINKCLGLVRLMAKREMDCSLDFHNSMISFHSTTLGVQIFVNAFLFDVQYSEDGIKDLKQECLSKIEEIKRCIKKLGGNK